MRLEGGVWVVVAPSPSSSVAIISAAEVVGIFPRACLPLLWPLVIISTFASVLPIVVISHRFCAPLFILSQAAVIVVPRWSSQGIVVLLGAH